MSLVIWQGFYWPKTLCVCVRPGKFLLNHMMICCLTSLSHDLKGGKSPLSTTCFTHYIMGDKSRLQLVYFLISFFFFGTHQQGLCNVRMWADGKRSYATVQMFKPVVFPRNSKKSSTLMIWKWLHTATERQLARFCVMCVNVLYCTLCNEFIPFM